MPLEGKSKFVGSREFLEKVCRIYGLPFDLITDLQISSVFDDVVKVHVVFLADRRIFAIDEESKKPINESSE